MAIEVTGGKEELERAKKRLADARASLANPAAGMKRVAVYLDQWVQTNFRGQGSKVGGWTPFTYGGRLSVKRKANAKSIDGRRYVNTNAKLLQDTGALRLSFLPFVRNGEAGIGSDLPYAQAHEKGEGVPKRRMLPEREEVQVDMYEILDGWLRVVTSRGA